MLLTLFTLTNNRASWDGCPAFVQYTEERKNNVTKIRYIATRCICLDIVACIANVAHQNLHYMKHIDVKFETHRCQIPDHTTFALYKHGSNSSRNGNWSLNRWFSFLLNCYFSHWPLNDISMDVKQADHFEIPKWPSPRGCDSQFVNHWSRLALSTSQRH